LPLLFGLGVAGLVSSFSRSAWLGAGLAAGLLLLVRRGKRSGERAVLIRLALIGGFICLIFISIWPGYFTARLVEPWTTRFGFVKSTSEDIELINLTTRADYVAVANQLIRAHFPWGVGGGNFSVAAYLANSDLPANYLHQPVHQVFLLITAELGVVGGLSWLFLVAALGLAGWRSRARLRQDVWLLGWSMALLGLSATSLFDFYLWGWQFGRLMLWAVLGLWAGRYTQGFPSDEAYGAARLKVPTSSVSIDT
jgi:O-antigen ligase